MENKVKMKAMLKQMQSVIALVIIFVVASVVCVKDGKNNFFRSAQSGECSESSI